MTLVINVQYTQGIYLISGVTFIKTECSQIRGTDFILPGMAFHFEKIVKQMSVQV